MTLRILVVSANPVVRAGLAVLLGACPDLDVTATAASDPRHALAETRRTAPDLVLLDGLPEALPRLTALAPVVHLAHAPAEGAGFAGRQLVHGRFEVADLLRAIREAATAHTGAGSTVTNILRFRNSTSRVQRFGLSAREVEVMDLIASGMTNQRIAATCSISEKTVKNHINRIFAKLHSTTRGEAIASWLGTRTAS
ncbi:response regulator transcription factor [Streptomyces sp. NPDC048718]|uniref:response regulator transcription factor n=1 Tax=Streptomyces sp. NPDC048718 TaxID=3365587 RepID=UPI00371C6870